MLMVYDDPLEKSTPDAWRTAFPLKLSAPEGSLIYLRYKNGQRAVNVGDAYTILPKFEKGVPKLWFCRFGRVASMENDGRLAPRPAPVVPPPIDVRGLSKSLNFKPGFGRREGGGRML
jgi:hypothetical protein